MSKLASGGIVATHEPTVTDPDADRIELMARAMAVADGYDQKDYDDEAWRLGWRCENPAQQLASSTDYRNEPRRHFYAHRAMKMSYT
jgi:hypothetical protein